MNMNMVPNMSDFKRGFGDDNRDDYLLPDPGIIKSLGGGS